MSKNFLFLLWKYKDTGLAVGQKHTPLSFSSEKRFFTIAASSHRLKELLFFVSKCKGTGTPVGQKHTPPSSGMFVLKFVMWKGKESLAAGRIFP